MWVPNFFLTKPLIIILHPLSFYRSKKKIKLNHIFLMFRIINLKFVLPKYRKKNFDVIYYIFVLSFHIIGITYFIYVSKLFVFFVISHIFVIIQNQYTLKFMCPKKKIPQKIDQKEM